MIYFSSLLIDEWFQFITEQNSVVLFSDVGRKYQFYLCIGATVIQVHFPFWITEINWVKHSLHAMIMPTRFKNPQILQNALIL